MRMKEGTVPASTAGSAPSTSTPSAPAAEHDAERVLDLRAVGDRIETLLEASSSGGTVARERSEELVRLLSELLLIHDLHPEDVSTRVERALDSVRPYLGSHGGDVELLGITDEGVVRLRLLGSCDGCSSSAATMSLAIEDAISQAAPEVTGFDVQSPAARPSAPPGRGLIPLAVVPHGSPQSATGQPDPPVSTGWMAVPGLDDLASGAVVGVSVAGVPIIVCRVGADLLAFRDGCADCGAGLAAARLERRLGSATGGGVLTCPACRTHYDVRLAGAAIDGAGAHLDPLPLLARHGRIEVAIPQSASESLSRVGSR
jgi:Fe-S cluster biogenesis protein NfuA/nitrite reductase/ring-hydroxylating ferredoxin subunit